MDQSDFFLQLVRPILQFFKLVNQVAQRDLCTAFPLLHCKKEAVWEFELLAGWICSNQKLCSV